MAAHGMQEMQQGMIALQQEMQQTRAQLGVVSGRFDQLLGAHNSL